MTIADLMQRGDIRDRAFYERLEAADRDEIAAIVALATHEDPEVRRNVASTLPLIETNGSQLPRIVEALIELTRDPCSMVRDWACMGLGSQLRDVDSPELREALMARLDDIDHDTRCEAMYGLALRRDPRVVSYVRTALSRPSGSLRRLELLSAGALSDPSLHDLVLRHLLDWDDERMVQTTDAVRRLTDPAGPGIDLLVGVAELYRRRANGEDDGEAIRWWRLIDEMLDLAPYREEEFLSRQD